MKVPPPVSPSKPPVSPAPPVAPWVPNEAPNLDATFEQLRRARAVIDGAIADLNSAVANAYWQGTDADQLRREWANQRTQLDSLCVQIGRLLPLLQQRSQAEALRYRQQATAPNGGY
jgi:hypothetical protein